MTTGPRVFTPSSLDATQWDQIEPLLNDLIARPVESSADLEMWLSDRSDLEAACSEARAQLYIALSCNTDDPAINAAYTAYIESVPPKLKPKVFELDKRFVSLASEFPLNPDRYAVLLRSKRSAIDLFRPENVPIQTEIAKLVQRYDQIAGRQTVQFEGREQTLAEMSRYLETPDRSTRESAWRGISTRRAQDRDALNDVYDQLITLRDRVARNAGESSYVEYAFKERERFDYTRQHCEAYWDAVERLVVPLVRRLDAERATVMGLSELRPWDLGVDPKGRPGLRPFSGGRQLVDKSASVFNRLDKRLAGMFDRLTDGISPTDEAVRTACLDLDSRKGKRPGGYQYMRDRQRQPFIFMNAAGVQRDVMTMVHEAGHAFHSFLCAHDPLVDYRHYPIEFAEVASMSMEHLTMPYWGVEGGFYTSDEDLARARRTHLEDSIAILAWIATIDGLQHWVYSNPKHTRPQRDAYWLELEKRFGRGVSWEGLHELHACAWQKQSHLFSHPLYYIEYGIAQLGALQLWLKARREGDEAAVNAYIAALSLGGSKPLPELFKTAGLPFDFGYETVARVVGAVEEELAALPV